MSSNDASPEDANLVGGFCDALLVFQSPECGGSDKERERYQSFKSVS